MPTEKMKEAVLLCGLAAEHQFFGGRIGLWRLIDADTVGLGLMALYGSEADPEAGRLLVATWNGKIICRTSAATVKKAYADNFGPHIEMEDMKC